MNENRELTGKIAIVFGGSRGIGAAAARRLAREGADVAVTYVSAPEQAAKTVTMHRSQETDIFTVQPRLRWLIRTSVIAALLLVLTSLLVAPAAFAQGNESEDRVLGPGCAPDRPAVAHHAGGVVVENPEGENGTLIPCLIPTDWRTAEVGIVVSNAGGVLFHPAVASPPTGLPLGILRSVNLGASWQFIQPPSGAGVPPWTFADDGNLGVDRLTGRVFQDIPGYFNLAPGVSSTGRVNFSDDGGLTWSVGGMPVMRFASGNDDNVKIFAGPPVKESEHLLRGYPDVVFNCAGHKPLRCQTSFDGGLTWGPPSDLPFPAELAPIQGPLQDCSNFGSNGVVGQHGTVYVGYTPCNRPYVGISRDEGATWQAVRVADVETIGWGQAAVGIDEQGNLYATWVAAADRLPYLAVSRDGGLRWTEPMMIGAPGVNEAALPRLVTGARGQVAVGYFGSTNSPGAPFPAPCTSYPQAPAEPATACPAWQNVTWNSYITETFNALHRQPLFWSATLNDPAQPTWYGCSASSLGVIRLDESGPYQVGPDSDFTGGCGPGPQASGRQDYIGMNMAPDNTPWVGFGQACPLGLPVPGNPRCPSTLTGDPSDALWGVVGRLVRVPHK